MERLASSMPEEASLGAEGGYGVGVTRSTASSAIACSRARRLASGWENAPAKTVTKESPFRNESVLVAGSNTAPSPRSGDGLGSRHVLRRFEETSASGLGVFDAQDDVAAAIAVDAGRFVAGPRRGRQGTEALDAGEALGLVGGDETARSEIRTGAGTRWRAGDADGVGEAVGLAVGDVPTPLPFGLSMMSAPPTSTMAMTAAAPMGMKRFMVVNLHGTREARRCGIDGNAARTVSSVSRGAWSGSASSQSAIRGSKSGRIVSWLMRIAPRTVVKDRPSSSTVRS